MPKKRIWTEEDIQKIIKLYCEDGLSISYIAKNIYKCRQSSISNILKENNIQKRPQTSVRKLNKIEQQTIIDLYTNHKYSQSQLAQKFSCTTYLIHKVLIDNNIKIVTQPRINKEVKEDYFTNIDTERKAYFLGFIFADGCIYKNQLSLEIHVRDKDLLETFKKELSLNSKISIRKRENSETCCVRVSSPQIANDLEKYGIIRNKTYQTTHLPKIKESVLPHFIRGLIDGDGWITKGKNGRYYVGFCSYSKSVCEDFKRYCEILINDKINNSILKSNNCYSCTFQNQSQIKRLITALYKDNTICLSRKYAIAESLLDFKDDKDIV